MRPDVAATRRTYGHRAASGRVHAPSQGGVVAPDRLGTTEPRSGHTAVVDDEEPFSTQLEHWLADDEPKTLGRLGEVFAEKSFAVTIMMLMFLPALPLPTGGITHVFEAIVVLLALQMVLGRRTIWLPERFRKRELGELTTGKAVPFMIRRIRSFERLSRPRLPELFDKVWFLRLLGLVFFALAFAAGFAGPFSGLDTLPALGAVVIALSIILGDVVLLGIGLGIAAGGIVLIFTVGAALFHAIRRLF